MTSDGGVWRGIAAELRRGIQDGRYPVGTRLPSIRRTAVEHAVAAGTVQTALDQLVVEGLIEKRHGSGHWVVRAEPLPDVERRLASVEQAMAEVLDRVERLERGRDS